MSASLVGSEMCIRDRPQSPPQMVSPGGFGVVLRAESGGDDETGRRARRTCLLYTSDAADDM
eukprot:8966957-Alexandrium_andersonii.AAC.1